MINNCVPKLEGMTQFECAKGDKQGLHRAAFSFLADVLILSLSFIRLRHLTQIWANSLSIWSISVEFGEGMITWTFANKIDCAQYWEMERKFLARSNANADYRKHVNNRKDGLLQCLLKPPLICATSNIWLFSPLNFKTKKYTTGRK